MPHFSSSKIIEQLFHVDNDKGESGIGYDMIIGCDLMIQLDLMANFKCQVLQWGGYTVLMKEPSGLLGNARRVNHYYATGDWFYVEMTGIYRKLDYKKEPYIITELFTNVTVRFQREK